MRDRKSQDKNKKNKFLEPINPSPTLLVFCSLLILILAIFLAARALPRLSSLALHLHPSLSSSSASPQLSYASRNTTPTMSSYAKELEIAQLAVQRAAILTKRVFHEKAKGTVSKDDKSPVTIGDFGAQALIIAALKHNFPEDEIVAEEEAAQLREDANLRSTIWGPCQGHFAVRCWRRGRAGWRYQE